MPLYNSPSSWVSLSFCESTGPRSRLVHQALWIQSQELYHSPTSTLFLQAMGPVHYSLGEKIEPNQLTQATHVFMEKK